jgi:putative endonuclease
MPSRKRTTRAFVYLVRCRDGSLYCGWAIDPEARVHTHNRGTGAAYTRSRLPVELVYVERCRNRSAALKREYAIKQLSRQQKQRLCACRLVRRRRESSDAYLASSPNGTL